MTVLVRFRRPSLWAVPLTFVALAFAGAADPSPRERLELFHKETPAARLRLVEGLPGGERAFTKATRGNLTATLVERGTLEPAEAADVVCRIKPQGKGSTTATTIKWIVEDGWFVKKGERVVELDDSAIREQLAPQKVAHEEATAAKVQAEEELKLTQERNRVDVRLGEIALKLAELELKKAAGAEREQREILELKVERARLELDRARAEARAKEKQAEAGLRARRAVLEREAARLNELEEQLRQCVLVAPRDGLALLVIPEQARWGSGSASAGIAAPGEPVKEGQRLVRVCDLRRMLVNVRVHEALVAAVRTGQKAVVRVDAFPNNRLVGEVTRVSAVASTPDWLRADVKVYPVVVALADEMPGLKPGMSAEVQIVLAERTNVVQVPGPAVVTVGREPVCYVKTADGLEERRVVPGARSDLAVEIKEGLKEGEVVLRDPRALVRQLDLRPARGGQPGEREGAARQGATDVLVRSVNPAADDAVARRTRIAAYGLTQDDLKRLGSLKGVSEVIPMRAFPCEARRRERMSLSRLVATTPGFAEGAGLTVAAGRFLETMDDEDKLNVVVLGSGVAAALFAEEDPLGQTVRLGNSLYRVVGVARAQTKGFAGLAAGSLNDAVYMPLTTCRVRFGERVFFRQAGSFRGEVVPISAIVVRAAVPEQAPAVAAAARILLGETHRQRDWDVLLPPRP
jgi:multidrug resistance efflux pump